MPNPAHQTIRQVTPPNQSTAAIIPKGHVDTGAGQQLPAFHIEEIRSAREFHADLSAHITPIPSVGTARAFGPGLDSRRAVTLPAPNSKRAATLDLSYVTIWSTQLTGLGSRYTDTLSAPDSRRAVTLTAPDS